MQQSQQRSRFQDKASLGAMSWNLPNDDWCSPWSFEDEWISPEKGWREKVLSQAESPDQVTSPSQSVPASPTHTVLPEARVSKENVLRHSQRAGNRTMSDVVPNQIILRFESEDDEATAAPLVPAAKAPVVPAISPAPPPVEDAPYRPPEAGEPKTISETTPASISVPAAVLPSQLVFAPNRSSDLRTETSRSLPKPTEEEHRHRTRKKIPRRSSSFSWGTLISLSLGTLGFTLLAWIYLHDEPRSSDEDLRPQVVIDQTPMTQAPKKLRAFLDSIRPLESEEMRRQSPWTWDTPTLSAFIRTNGTAFDNLRDLLEDYDWHPHHSNWHLADLSLHESWGHVGYLLQGQSAYLARRGDEEPAFVAAMDLAEFSRRLQEVWAWPGYMRRALDLQTASVQLMAELLKTTRLDAATLARYQNEFTRCQPDDEVMRQALAAYYIHEKKLLLGPASGELLDTMPGGQLHQRPGRLFFKVNETLALFASAFRDLQDEVTRPPYTRLSVSVVPSIRLTTPRFYHPNSNGEVYLSDHLEPYLRLPQDQSLIKARHGLVRCLFGLRRYLADRKTLPGYLNELTPEYLTSVPQDPFSGEPFQYESARGLLYSVGLNLIAEGGRPTDPPLNDDREPTVELGIAMAIPVKK